MATSQFQRVQKHLLFIRDKQKGWLVAIATELFVCINRFSVRWLDPKPTEVIGMSAFRYPDVNRSTDFLPCETKYDNKIQ